MSCPICGKAVVAEHRPFCSRRCADIDLGRWLNEDYRLPARPEDDSADPGSELPDEAPGRRPI